MIDSPSTRRAEAGRRLSRWLGTPRTGTTRLAGVALAWVCGLYLVPIALGCLQPVLPPQRVAAAVAWAAAHRLDLSPMRAQGTTSLSGFSAVPRAKCGATDKPWTG